MFLHSGESQMARNRIYITLTKVQARGLSRGVRHSYTHSIPPIL